LAHVAEFRKNNPEVSYKDCLKEAKKTYIKGGVLVQNAPNVEGGAVKSKKSVKVVKTKATKATKATKKKVKNAFYLLFNKK
jgi:hypothetical protein